MKIKEVSTEQFAGICLKPVSFKDGINVVYGKNESGKSTLVNLISKTLFQNVRIDGRKEKKEKFKELYFPVKRKGSGVQGDFIDGKVSFEAEDGIYTLSKVWGEGEMSELTSPRGDKIHDTKKIEEEIRKALHYGKGVYSGMLLSPQKDALQSLENLLNKKEDTDGKKEVTAVLTRAFGESDGVSIDRIEEKIDGRIDEIAKKHWDFEQGCPKKRSDGQRWGDKAEILKAYYDYEDACKLKEEIDKLEAAYEKIDKNYRALKEKVGSKKDEIKEFKKYKTALADKNKIERLKEEWERAKNSLNNWRKSVERFKKAERLQEEAEQRCDLDKYTRAKNVKEEIKLNETKQKEMLVPTEEEIQIVKHAESEVENYEKQLSGMNLAASIRMFGEHTIEVKSVQTGKEIDVSQQDIVITEAVSIAIPGIMEMCLSPANVDAASVRSEIDNQKSIISSIFEKYKVNAPEELDRLSDYDRELQEKIENSKNELKGILGDSSYEELKESAEKFTDVRTKEEIDEEIRSVFQGKDKTIGEIVSRLEGMIENYEKEHKTMESLSEKISGLSEEIEQIERSMKIEDIPEKYSRVSDVEKYLRELEEGLEKEQDEEKKVQDLRTEAKTKLDGRQEENPDFEEKCKEADRQLNEKKRELSHWVHIREVFEEQRDQLFAHPMKGLSESFARYLGVISENKVSSEFLEKDKMNMDIYSGGRLLDYDKLSEGTKETVFLAFRLAIMDELFPDDGGILVLDDPLNDMDKERAEQSCRLIQECAKRHQIIFLTCREEYLNMLGGNPILLDAK